MRCELNYFEHIKKSPRALHYILDADGNPVPEDDILAWAKWRQNPRNIILKRTDLPGGVIVSTVFLGIDHAFHFFGDPRPVLWETMIFEGEHDDWQDRYHTKEEALLGHEHAVKIATGECEDEP